MARVRQLLKRLRNMLEQSGEHHFVNDIDAALAADDTVLWSFLTSNELWGGAGSIADQGCGPSRDTRRPLEQLLAELGREQIAWDMQTLEHKHGLQSSSSGMRKTSNQLMSKRCNRTKAFPFMSATLMGTRSNYAKRPNNSVCSPEKS